MIEDDFVTKLDVRPPSWSPSWTEAPPVSVREFFPAWVHAANNETEFGTSQTVFYSMAREWRRGTHALKAPSPRREGVREFQGLGGRQVIRL